MMILQEYIQSETMELLIQQTVSPLVSEYSGGLFYLRTKPIDTSKYAKLSVITFGIEDWGTAQTNVSARQFLIQSD
jgi:hypothetical protein